jgi:hypothetical protein
MIRKVEIKARRDDMMVGTLETDSPLTEAFPHGSIVVVKPNGSDARSNMTLGTLRKEWATHQKTSPDSYKKSGATEVEINPLGTVDTLRQRIAEALGLPAEALQLRLPDKQEVNPKAKVATFLTPWQIG